MPLSTSPITPASSSASVLPEPARALTAEDLTQLREQADWRLLFTILQIESDPRKSKPDDWWGKSPFKPEERTASFHINDRGWFCHSTAKGGGVIELVQAVYPTMSCYDAGRWLIEHGVCRISEKTRAQVARTIPQKPAAGSFRENSPIRQDLCSQLSVDHPAFMEREIPPDVLHELGAGYLERPPRKNGRPDPMNRRLVFQVRGLEEQSDGVLKPVVLGHIGRATTKDQHSEHGKWWTYAGFRKSLEVYNLDLALHDERALDQATQSGHLLLVEGCFDVAKLFAAGIRNVVATLGAHLSTAQVEKLDLFSEVTGCDRFLVWYDRDQDGRSPQKMGASDAVEQLIARGFEASAFDWHQTFTSPSRTAVVIPTTLQDPCDFSLAQLQWLRREEWI